MFYTYCWFTLIILRFWIWISVVIYFSNKYITGFHYGILLHINSYVLEDCYMKNKKSFKLIYVSWFTFYVCTTKLDDDYKLDDDDSEQFDEYGLKVLWDTLEVRFIIIIFWYHFLISFHIFRNYFKTYVLFLNYELYYITVINYRTIG